MEPLEYNNLPPYVRKARQWPKIVLAAVVLIIALVVALQINSGIDRGRAAKDKAESDKIAAQADAPKDFYSDDDGQTYYTAPAGGAGIRAHVFKCGGGIPFVAYLEKGTMVKRPGDKQWSAPNAPPPDWPATPITTVKCKDGSYAKEVYPN